MIQVEGLGRTFGSTRAVDGISFSVGRGEVVGLLGPNGAGKTTTMRMICGCIGATEGHIRIEGQALSEAPIKLKAQIGYLPESPPLYRSMSVESYLRFAADIHSVEDVASAVDKVLSQVGLQEVRERIIGHLSKGYRQRVGLAQALVHDPQVLILDEPSSGLDPAQRVEIRELLRELANGERTVILSTHILEDVEAICQRALIIHEGRLVGDESLQRSNDKDMVLRAELARPSGQARAILKALDGVEEVEELNSAMTEFRICLRTDIREVLVLNLASLGLISLELETGLEQIYLRRIRESSP